jgi:hypothetical protein
MGTFAETANSDYRLSFADQRKQTSVFLFLFAENKRKLAISVPACSKQMEVVVFL